MPTTIIGFPPRGAGNHVRNLILSCSTWSKIDATSKQEVLNTYTTQEQAKHSPSPGVKNSSNLTKFKLSRALMHPSSNTILYGHFAELMSSQDEILQIPDKKFILIGPDDQDCVDLLNQRNSAMVGQTSCLDYYQGGEQILLYQAPLYASLFNTKEINIINISISQLFSHNISAVLENIAWLLDTTFDAALASDLHNTWRQHNNINH